MAILKPFCALHPIPAKASQVAAPPYDVLDCEEARALTHGNPLSFLHVSKSEMDLPLDTPLHSPLIYQRAAENLNRMIREVPFVEEAEALYAYRLKIKDHTQLGVFGCFSLDEYDVGTIKRHELTRKTKEDDRTCHTLALQAHTGPTYLTYRDQPEVAKALKTLTSTAPLFDFLAEDGVTHTLWKTHETKTLCQLFRNTIPVLYIADGHHRAAASSRARKESKEPALGSSEADQEMNYFLAAAFPASELKLLPYHRIVKDLASHSPKEFLQRVSEKFTIQPWGTTSPPSQPRTLGIYLDQWYQAIPSQQIPSLHDLLDVELLQTEILEPILKIDDPRSSTRIDFVGGVRGTHELEQLVQSGKAAIAFTLHPTSIQEMMSRCDLGSIMPPKSTWFEPKLRDGLLIHRF